MLVPHTPDPAQGAIIDALDGGLARIMNPDDNELVNGNIGRSPSEQISDWVAYLKSILWARTRRGIFTFANSPTAQPITYIAAPTAITPVLQSNDITAELVATGIGTGFYPRMRVVRDTPLIPRELIVKNGVGGATIATVPDNEIGWIEAEFDDTDWIITAWGGVVAF